MQKLLIVMLVAASLLTTTRRAPGDVALATDFLGVEATQKTPVWCWAACIQMVLNYHGVQWQQEDVVLAVKGYLARETASNAEIVGFLNQAGFDYDGDRWASRCAFYQGAPNPTWLIDELLADRPLIVSYQTGPNSGHVVILFAAEYQPTPQGPIIRSVQIYDPFTNENRIVPGTVVATQTTGHWFVDVRKIER